MNILPKSLVSGITSFCFTQGMEEGMAGMVLNKGMKLCGHLRAFPLAQLGNWAFCRHSNPSGK